MSKETKRYKLAGKLVVELDTNLQTGENAGTWAMPLFFDPPDEADSSIVIGHCRVDHDILIMFSWKVRDELPPEWATEELADKDIDALPKWDFTEYCIKMGDFSCDALRVCATGEPATDEEIDAAMPILEHYGLHRVKPEPAPAA